MWQQSRIRRQKRNTVKYTRKHYPFLGLARRVAQRCYSVKSTSASIINFQILQNPFMSKSLERSPLSVEWCFSQQRNGNDIKTITLFASLSSFVVLFLLILYNIPIFFSSFIFSYIPLPHSFFILLILHLLLFFTSLSCKLSSYTIFFSFPPLPSSSSSSPPNSS